MLTLGANDNHFESRGDTSFSAPFPHPPLETSRCHKQASFSMGSKLWITGALISVPLILVGFFSIHFSRLDPDGLGGRDRGRAQSRRRVRERSRRLNHQVLHFVIFWSLLQLDHVKEITPYTHCGQRTAAITASFSLTPNRVSKWRSQPGCEHSAGAISHWCNTRTPWTYHGINHPIPH